jgi:hypothetical protein
MNVLTTDLREVDQQVYLSNDAALPRIMRRPKPAYSGCYRFGYVKDGKRVWLPQKYADKNEAERQAQHFKRANPGARDVQVVEA